MEYPPHPGRSPLRYGTGGSPAKPVDGAPTPPSGPASTTRTPPKSTPSPRGSDPTVTAHGHAAPEKPETLRHTQSFRDARHSLRYDPARPLIGRQDLRLPTVRVLRVNGHENAFRPPSRDSSVVTEDCGKRLWRGRVPTLHTSKRPAVAQVLSRVPYLPSPQAYSSHATTRLPSSAGAGNNDETSLPNVKVPPRRVQSSVVGSGRIPPSKAQVLGHRAFTIQDASVSRPPSDLPHPGVRGTPGSTRQHALALRFSAAPR